jgi:hypothetical protein
MRANVVWLAPSATSFSCLCETCLEEGRAQGRSFLETLRAASVRGTVARESNLAFAYCASGHRFVLRRVERPARLAQTNERQLQLR